MREVMSDFAEFIMRSSWHAAVLASVLAVISLYFLPLALLAAAVVALVTLRRGGWSGTALFLAALVPVAVSWYLVPPRPGLEVPLIALLGTLTLLSSVILRTTQAQGQALLTIGLLVMTGVVAIELLSGNATLFWKAWLQQAVQGVKGARMEGFERDGTLRLMNGIIGFLLGASAFLSLLLARWMQSLLYNPQGFAPEFQGLRLSRLALLVTLALVLVARLRNPELQLHVLLIAMMVYAFAGVAVIHGVATAHGLGWFWLLPPYIALVVVPQFAVTGLAALGVLDTLVNFRRLPRRAGQT
jgi:hypothetical protein